MAELVALLGQTRTSRKAFGSKNVSHLRFVIQDREPVVKDAVEVRILTLRTMYTTHKVVSSGTVSFQALSNLEK